MSRDLDGRSLLAVFAHPDDESFACGGLLAWCADRGVRVTLLCATRGENGPSADVARDQLPSVRERELRDAARVLGAADVVLLDFPDGELNVLDEPAAQRLQQQIRQTIDHCRADVVITFGDDGLYWHPDHVALHYATSDAVASFDEAAPALYYVTIPPGLVRSLVQALPHDRTGSSVVLGVVDPDAFGSLAQPPTLVVRAAAYAARKLAAIRCHRTQVAGGALTMVAEADAGRLLGLEHFHRAAVGRQGATFLDTFGS